MMQRNFVRVEAGIICTYNLHIITWSVYVNVKSDEQIWIYEFAQTWIAQTADLRSCPGSPNFMWVQGLFGPVRPACTMGTAFGGHFLGKNVLTIRLLEKAFSSAIAPNLICRICRNLWSSNCSLLVPRFEQQPTLDCEVERSERRECVEEGRAFLQKMVML